MSASLSAASSAHMARVQHTDRRVASAEEAAVGKAVVGRAAVVGRGTSFEQARGAGARSFRGAALVDVDEEGRSNPTPLEAIEPRARKKRQVAGPHCRRCNMPTTDYMLQMGMCPECALEHVLAGMPTSSRRSEAKEAAALEAAAGVSALEGADARGLSHQGPAAATKRAKERHLQAAMHDSPSDLHPEAAAGDPSDGLDDLSEGSSLSEGGEGEAGMSEWHSAWARERRRGNSIYGPMLSENTIVRQLLTSNPHPSPLTHTPSHHSLLTVPIAITITITLLTPHPHPHPHPHLPLTHISPVAHVADSS